MSYPHELLHNGAQLRLVGVHPTAKTAFYVNDGKGGVVGVRVYPDGRKVVVNTSGVKYGKTYSHGKAEYLKFRDAWGRHLQILASHAVFCAWRHEIPAGMTIDHINGVTTDNDFRNLRCVSNEINNRDGGFLTKLRNKVDRADLMTILFYDIPVVYDHFKQHYHLDLPFKMGLL